MPMRSISIDCTASQKFAGRVAYLAGPPILVDVSIRMLITQGRLPVRDIRYDKFS